MPTSRMCWSTRSYGAIGLPETGWRTLSRPTPSSASPWTKLELASGPFRVTAYRWTPPSSSGNWSLETLVIWYPPVYFIPLFFSCLPSIMRSGLLPGGTRGTRYRRHVHLAMSHSPTAGLREGSEVILVIDLMRAHNAGCVFYVSDNNVILTEDCIPPPCIARAQYTSTGEAYDLSRLRTAYKMACAAPDLSELALLGLDHSTAWSVTQTQLAHLPCRRCSLRSESGALSLNSRAWTLWPFGQVLDSLAAYRLPFASAVHLLRGSLPGMFTATQPALICLFMPWAVLYMLAGHSITLTVRLLFCQV